MSEPQAFVSVPDGSRTQQSATSGQLLITGVDRSGRSCAMQNGPVNLEGFPGFDGLIYANLYELQSDSLLPGGGRAADKLSLGVAAGTVNWKMIEYGPGVAFSMHHTDTVDLDFVLSGSVVLILDDGEHPLRVGDAAVVTGVDHAWRTGPEGCRLSVISIGVAPAN